MNRSKGPLSSLFVMLYFLITGLIKFPKQSIADEIVDGKNVYTVFRHMTHARRLHSSEKKIYQVTGKFKTAGQKKNKNLSAIPTPFIAAQPGFRSKIWAMDKKTGYIMGYYEWDTEKNARQYKESFPMKLMISRTHKNIFKCYINGKPA